MTTVTLSRLNLDRAKVGRIGLKDLKNPENPHFLDLDLGFEILSEDLDCFDKKSNPISNPQSLLVRTKMIVF